MTHWLSQLLALLHLTRRPRMPHLYTGPERRTTEATMHLMSDRVRQQKASLPYDPDAVKLMERQLRESRETLRAFGVEVGVWSGRLDA